MFSCDAFRYRVFSSTAPYLNFVNHPLGRTVVILSDRPISDPTALTMDLSSLNNINGALLPLQASLLPTVIIIIDHPPFPSGHGLWSHDPDQDSDIMAPLVDDHKNEFSPWQAHVLACGHVWNMIT